MNKDIQSYFVPVENMTFLVKEEFVEKFINLDTDIWTMFLKEQPGFISKEIWICNPMGGSCFVKTITKWASQKHWDEISKKELCEKQAEFDRSMPNDQCRLISLDYQQDRYFLVLQHIK